MSLGEQHDGRAIARNRDALFGKKTVQPGNELAVVQQDFLRRTFNS